MTRNDPRTRTSAGSAVALPVEQALLLEEVCDRFEAAWRADRRPRIEDAVANLIDPVRAAAVRELVLLDADYRRAAGESPRSDEYGGRFPELDAEWLAGAVGGGGEPPDRTATAAAGTVPPQPGTCVGYFGDYELIEEIARGGMGVVYRARQVSLDRVVALKMIRSGEFTSDTEARRFRQEVEAVATLDHPHVVPVYEVGEYRGRQYYTMRLIEGGTLAGRMAELSIPTAPGRDRQAAVARLVASVARAVHHAHQRGVLHRDLKPSNVLLDTSGEPHVADFGLARRLGSASSLTATGAVLGTPSYMAPEQARGGKDVTTAADVYGLGAVLYELLTGRPPFKGADALDTLAQVRERAVTRPRAACPAVDADLETVCLKCLEKDPARRYSSADALADDLDRWQKGEPILARPAGMWERARKWVQRNPTAAGLVAVTALFLLAAVGGSVTVVYSRTLEGKNRELAAAKNDADGQRAAADRLRERAESAEAESWRRLYFARMAQANTAYRAGNAERVIELLTPYREPTPGKPDPRGFEWHYLWRAARGDVFTVRAHPGGILAVAYSQDGNTIATGGADGTVRLWGATTGAAGVVFDAGEGAARVTGVGFVPGTTWLAAGVAKSAGGEVRVWDLQTGATVREFSLAGGVNGIAVHPEGSHLAVACGDGLVRVMNLITGDEWDQTNDGVVNCVAFSRNGKQLAAGGLNPKEEVRTGWVRLWNWPDGNEVVMPKGASRGVFFRHGEPVTSLNFSPREDHILVATSSARNRPLSPFNSLFVMPSGIEVGPNGRTLWRLNSPDGNGFTTARFLSPELVVLGRAEGPLHVYTTKPQPEGEEEPDGSQPPVHSFAGHTGSVSAAAVSPAGRFFATIGSSRPAEGLGELRVWDTAPDHFPLVVRGESSHHHAGISPDGRWLATAVNDGTIRVCSAVTGAEVFREKVIDRCLHVAFSPHGTWLAATNTKGAIVWRTHDWTKYHVAVDPQQEFLDPIRLSFSQDERFLAVSADSERLVVHDLEQRGVHNSWAVELDKDGTPMRGEWICGVSISPDGERVATLGENGLIRVWRVESGKCEFVFRPGQDQSYTVVFSADGQRVAVSGMNGRVSIHDAADGTKLVTFVGHDPKKVVWTCCYTADGTRLVTASADGTVRLWETASGQELLTLRPFEGWPVEAEVMTADVSGDGRRIIVNARNGLVRVIDPPSSDPVSDLDPGELVYGLFVRFESRAEVLTRLRTDPTLTAEVRQAALKLAEKLPATEKPDRPRIPDAVPRLRD